MKKKRILQAVVLTVLFLFAAILGVIVFLPSPTIEPRSIDEPEVFTIELMPTPSPTPLLPPSPTVEAEATKSPPRNGRAKACLR